MCKEFEPPRPGARSYFPYITFEPLLLVILIFGKIYKQNTNRLLNTLFKLWTVTLMLHFYKCNVSRTCLNWFLSRCMLTSSCFISSCSTSSDSSHTSEFNRASSWLTSSCLNPSNSTPSVRSRQKWMRDRLSPFTWKGETTVKKCETCFASRYFEILSSNLGLHKIFFI